ncbi:MAG: GNAT family N-acetyltransferase [Acidimicrobiales bacterium]|jgi:GNAT superfamily N-acetyltransferase
MRIRVAEAGDIDVLCQLRIEFLTEHRGLDPSALSRRFVDETRRFFRRSIDAGTLLSWLAEEGGTAVGLVSVLLQSAPPRPEDVRSVEGLIINMFVRRDERGRGVGRTLLRSCLAAGPSRGIRAFTLYATDSGRPLYLKEGFSTAGNWMVLRLPPEP